MNKSYLLLAIRATRGAPSAGTVGGVAPQAAGPGVPTVTDVDRAKRLCQALDIAYTGQSLATVESAATTALGGITYQSGSRK